MQTLLSQFLFSVVFHVLINKPPGLFLSYIIFSDKCLVPRIFMILTDTHQPLIAY